MTQEVEVTLTLEVDVRISKETIRKGIESMINFHNDNIRIKSIREESEIYQTE